MSILNGFGHGVGLGGWLTNFKRLRLLSHEQGLTLSAGDYEHFDTFITEQDVSNIASWGADHIRFAFDYNLLEDDENPKVLREKPGFYYIDKFVGWCRKYNLNIIFDLHRAAGSSCEFDDSGLIDKPELQDRFYWIWQEIAKHYAGTEHFIAFELLNEVHVENSEKWNIVAARAVEAIRAISPNRKIIVGCNQFGNVGHLKYLPDFDDDKIIYSFHFYSPMEFTHQKATVIPAFAAYNRYMKYPSPIEPYIDCCKFLGGTGSQYKDVKMIDFEYLKNSFAPVKEFVKTRNKPLYCGEFGVIRHCDIQSRENYYSDIVSLCKEYGAGFSIWNYLSAPYDSNRFSIVDDWDRKPLSEKIINLVAQETVKVGE